MTSSPNSTSGNGNFANPNQILVTARANLQSQILIDEFENTIDRIAANFDKNGGDELIQMAAMLIGKLPVGMLGQMQDVIARVTDNKGDESFQSFWEKFKDEIKKEENKRYAMADLAGDMQQTQQQIEQAREAQWDNSTHNFAGMDMNGEEIDSLIDFMKKPSNRAKLIAKIAKKNGGDIDKATKTLDNAILYADLYKKIEKGTATPEEKAKFDELDKTPGVKEAAQLAHQEQKNTLTQNAEAKAGNTLNSMSTFKDNFSTAPNLREHHAAAIAALTPLDDKPKLFAANEAVVNPPSNTGLTF